MGNAIYMHVLCNRLLLLEIWYDKIQLNDMLTSENESHGN